MISYRALDLAARWTTVAGLVLLLFLLHRIIRNIYRNRDSMNEIRESNERIWKSIETIYGQFVETHGELAKAQNKVQMLEFVVKTAIGDITWTVGGETECAGSPPAPSPDSSTSDYTSATGR